MSRVGISQSPSGMTGMTGAVPGQTKRPKAVSIHAPDLYLARNRHSFLPQDTLPRPFVTETSFPRESSAPGPLRPVDTISSWRPALAPALQPFSRQWPSSGSPLNHSPSSSLQESDSLPRPNSSPYIQQPHFYSLSSAPPSIPTTAPFSQPFDTTFAQEPDLWTQSHLSFANTDWNIVSADHSVPYPDIDVAVNNLGYGMTPTFTSISDSASNEPQSFAPSPLVPSPPNSLGSASTSSPPTSQGDEVLGRVGSSRVEKRRLNTLAARRCRQRRVDRMQTLEDELESVKRERDELRLRVSKMEGETEALKGLLTRKSK
ncbi:hypothetical protein N7481_008049 [Penicillium waksmanii]|uniref:uncharacterized protein n=1 Tax=Penicillium waksmanii TaxID=69791 RepID=UPI002548F7C3|nr:uncharacterized protein N7481_008049 [Penicillium waksmanii]KAJ5980751.1 hypothetical protein N7481_008049 [Penicillium waksmanii]